MYVVSTPRPWSTLRALPTLLRIGVAETVAYRAEFVVWLLTTTMPLVMLSLWTSVADEAPFHGYGADDFVAYYLLALIIRNLTSSWVSWQLSDEIRSGVLAMRLLQPIHPYVSYAATHLSAVPLRALIATPVAIILLFTNGRIALTPDHVRLAMLLPSIALAWALTFSLLLTIGSLAFFIEKSQSILDVYFGLFTVFSGYLLPLSLLPSWLASIARIAPFRFMLSVPIEIATRADLTRGGAGMLVAGQIAWAIGMFALSLWTWRAGIKRFEAVGG